MSGQYSDLQPAVAPDGSHLVFASFRPNGPTAPGVAPVKTEGLWRVDRKGTRWGEPARLPATVNLSSRVFKPSIAADGSLYFMAMDPAKQKFRLYRSQWRDGSYQPAVPLPFSDGSASDVDPEIAPDESFLLFSSAGRRPGNDNEHLFIVPRTASGWGQVTPIRYSGDEQAVDERRGPSGHGPDHAVLQQRTGGGEGWATDSRRGQSRPRTPEPLGQRQHQRVDAVARALAPLRRRHRSHHAAGELSPVRRPRSSLKSVHTAPGWTH